MKFLHDRRTAGVLALLSATIGAAALFFGIAPAHAGYPCNDQPAPQDTHVNISNEVFVGVDTNPGVFSNWVWVCAGAPGGEGNQRFVVVTAADPSGGGGPGMTVQSGGCTGVVGGQGFPPGCTYLVRPVGFDTSPWTGVDLPADGNGVTGAGAGTGTCLWLESTSATCPFGGVTIATASVAEGDVSLTWGTNSGCVTAAGNPCITTAPNGAGVSVAKGDPWRPTVDATVASTVPVTVDVGQCIGFHAPPGC
jgi:hypothetical protein